MSLYFVPFLLDHQRLLTKLDPLAAPSLCIATAQWFLESLHSVRLAYFGHSCSVLELATIGSVLLIKSWIQVRSGVSALERGIIVVRT